MSGKKPSYTRDEYGTWNPMQRQLGQTTFDYLNNIVKTGSPLYGGDYTSPLTAGEQEAIDRNARISRLAEEGLSFGLKGEFPEEYYQSNVYKPAMKQWTEDVLPGLEEQYAGSGGYWGSARANAVAKGLRDLYDKLVGSRADLAWQARNAVPSFVNAANALSQTEAQMQQIPRLIKQYGLDQKYNEWVRQQGANQQAINQALGFLDISTVTEKYNPGKAGNWGMLANIAGLALAPVTGGASLALSSLAAPMIDSATSPTGQGGMGSQISGYVNALAGLGGFGSSTIPKGATSYGNGAWGSSTPYYTNPNIANMGPQMSAGNYNRLRAFNV